MRGVDRDSSGAVVRSSLGEGETREEMAGASMYYMCFQVFMGHSKLENRKRESIISKAPLEWKGKNDT